MKEKVTIIWFNYFDCQNISSVVYEQVAHLINNIRYQLAVVIF